MSKKSAPSFENQMLRLQEIVDELEKPNLSLEKNVALYKEGRSLVKACKALLQTAKNEVLVCEENEEEKVFDLLTEEDEL